MDKRTALHLMSRDGANVLVPIWAEVIAGAFDRSLDRVGQPITSAREVLEETTHLEDRVSLIWTPKREQEPKNVHIKVVTTDLEAGVVPFHDLAARIALSYDLYRTYDHATQTFYHNPVVSRRYIACRAAVRLSRLFGLFDWLREDMRDLQRTRPWIEERIMKEHPFTGTDIRLGGPRNVLA